MPSFKRLYHGSVRPLSLFFVALGLALLISTLVNGGSLLSLGMLLGVVFLAVGAGRLWITAQTSR